MLKLMLKDFVLNRVTSLVYFILVLLCIGLYALPNIECRGKTTLVMVPFFVNLLLFCLITIYLFYGDFQSNGLRYICTFPIDRRTIVLSKFAATTVLMASPFVIFLAVCLLQGILGVEVSSDVFYEKVKIMLLSFSMTSVCLSTSLPSYFRHDYIKARNRSMILPIILALAFGGILFVYYKISGTGFQGFTRSLYERLLSPASLALVLFVTFCAFAVSLKVSMAVFYKKDLFVD